MREPTKPPEKPRPSSLLSLEEWERPRTPAELAESKAAAKDLLAYRESQARQKATPAETPRPPFRLTLDEWEREPSDAQWAAAQAAAKEAGASEGNPGEPSSKTWPALRAEARQAVAREAADGAAAPPRSPAEVLARVIARFDAAQPSAEPPVFCDWDARPAVLFSASRGEALALLDSGGTWIPVDALDVAHTGRVVASAEVVQARFASTFGAFDVPDTFAEAGRPARRLAPWRPQR